ncbi:putative TetR family transcriptional regulator [Listeria weihenstephanensis FSL R9-0317]|uniref:TetR family transcriptional regulator n=1 Tax=Listeria weihenstephanensis TaxID=1006155 RepID=A0A1S7FSJ8_9LIST|nr:TetR/AcrR family transcriptional regulator [Listeria weihenstephanensis]AQY50428.1 TetR family transcriptional regulator [Listeria weihenstephanensis]EUJ41439.1 putative TetR family transcriptional regulator [Listeria weihenstephanensis FSL R9-0317]
MKKDRREAILDMAQELFSENGYNDVSMRNVADALQISVGNLTYYFKRKEDLIEAVILEQSKGYQLPETPRTLLELHQFFIQGIVHQKKNDYFFRYSDQLAQVSDEIYQLQVRVLKTRFEMLQESFAILESAGNMEKEQLPGQIDGVVELINMVKVYWMPASDLYNSSAMKESPLNSLWGIVYPLLTEQGKRIFKEEIELELE